MPLRTGGARLAADGRSSLAWLVADGWRRVPHLGTERNDLWWSLRVAVVNPRRLPVLGLIPKTAPGCWPEIRYYRPRAA